MPTVPTRRARPVILEMTFLRACVTLVVLLAGSAWCARSAAAAAPLPGLHVVGHQVLDDGGKPVILRGVNRAGTEYACVQGWGIFDGPSSDASARAIASWHINFVRVLLNEDCWLGINGIKPAYRGARYRQAIVDYVRRLHQHGIYTEISLIWAAPGRRRATNQPGAPDADHSPKMWASMAATFKNDPDTVLAPWGEPQVNAHCLLRGGSSCSTTSARTKPLYRTAGMQQAVNVMRAAGYAGPIAIPGISYANNLSQWLAYEPRDPLHQLIAEAHVYGKNTCSSVSCFDQTMAPVAQQVPLIFGETGETYDASSCGSSNISTFLHWADSHAVGYAAWTWDTWKNCHALISNYNGSPAHRYGAFLKRYLAGLVAPPPPGA
jgi:endoglucanase